MDDSRDFLRALGDLDAGTRERAVALLWWHGRADHNVGRSPSELASEISAAGYPTLNVTRLRRTLEADRRTAKAPKGCFRIRIDARGDLDSSYGPLAGYRPVRKSDSVLPAEVFADSRDYIEKVVSQLNASYDAGLFDCCAVMCRRLAETLLIEMYEAKGRAHLLKDAEGHFYMFAGLLSVVEGDDAITLSRNALRALKDFKRLGDLSAHNRRFNARRDDIDRIRDGLRLASEEMLKIAGLSK